MQTGQVTAQAQDDSRAKPKLKAGGQDVTSGKTSDMTSWQVGVGGSGDKNEMMVATINALIT